MRTNLALLSLLTCFSVACFRNPVSGKNELSLVSEKDEIALGEQGAQEVRQTIGLYKDDALQKYVSDLGLAMAKQSERPHLPWSFEVVDDAAVNAFALPGGKIFVTRGLLAHANSDAELVSVLGHEIGHVTARHSVQQISKAQVAQLGLGIGAALSEDVAKYAGAASAGMQLLFLKFGRDAERQSDDLGFKYAIASGYDARAMATMFQTLKRVSDDAAGEGGGKLPSFLATHPDPDERVTATERRVKAHEGKTDFAKLENAREPYLARLSGLVFGDDPKNGFFQGNTFFHPGLGISLAMPAGWKHQNSPEAVAAASPEGDAVAQFSLTAAKTPEEAAKKVLGQEGIQPGTVSQTANPLTASAPFEAKTEQGNLEGLAKFVALDGRVYQLLGYTKKGELATKQPQLRTFLDGLKAVPAASMPKVETARLTVLPVPRATTLAQLAASNPSSLSVKALATLNGLDPAAQIPAGAKVKWVTGGAAPRPQLSLVGSR